MIKCLDLLYFDVVLMDIADILMGRPWLFDRDDVHHQDQIPTLSLWTKKKTLVEPTTPKGIVASLKEKFNYYTQSYPI